MKTYPIRRATTDDLADVMELRHDAERWLASRGIRQWLPEWAERAYAKIRQGVEDGTTWLVYDGNTPIATVSLGGPDLDFWNEDDDLASGLHFYKLITARSRAGAGLAEAVIDWVSRRAAAEGKKWVRLDCWRDNDGLKAYYRRIGFEHIRTEAREWRESGALFQRRAGLTTARDLRVEEA
ncbi:GNAT family N-acetyltransferase [Streptomyces tubbatahanensis]|uniref:GNAT family N-acetyltransferase n=1 Tax=Streptomyces tubbatahanensis TaxID=2923272 RepID=A0ABY3XXJ1_9ACTN|nr:GNAT family N-acetyltransferase [Streptomyces tubbatahanensis]UNS99237.1 GNAT family N-acetyltransferase [Streptomyces tubbatahanensis]